MRPVISDVADGRLVQSEFCYKHQPAQQEITARLAEYIRRNEKIVGMNASGATFADMDMSGKKFYGCNFRHCFFRGIRSEGVRARLTAFDFAILTDCTLNGTTNLNVSFGGTKLIHVLFTGSDQIQVNFSGLQSFQCSFDDSNLYMSRFIRANLVDTSFRNCNVKRTIFYDLNHTNVSFKLTNTREAIFDKRGSALFLGGDGSDDGIIC